MSSDYEEESLMTDPSPSTDPVTAGVRQHVAVLIVWCMLAVAVCFPDATVLAEEETDRQELLDRVNAQLSKFSRLDGCEFPQISEYKISRERMQERGSSPLAPMERKFAIRNSDDNSNYQIYVALIAAGFIENNREPSQIAGESRPTFSLTMKGWKAFPLNRGGQRTCIYWVVPDHATAIVKSETRPNGMKAITYERDMTIFPDWLLPTMKARYQRQNSITLPESLTNQMGSSLSARFGELSDHDPERIRSRFPSDTKAFEMAQSLLDNRVEHSKEPCIPIGAGYVEKKSFLIVAGTLYKNPVYYFSASIHPKHLGILRVLVREGYLKEIVLDESSKTSKDSAQYAFQITSKYSSELDTSPSTMCVRYGRAVAKEVVRTPDGQRGYGQYFVVRYEITDIPLWMNLPGIGENLPEAVQLCIKNGSLMQVDAERPGNGGMPGCSLSWF